MHYDVIVIGGTPGGIAAAVTAARLGRTVALIEAHDHFGGMSASGLGKSDVETPELIGGLFREFVGRVKRHYDDAFGPESPEAAACRGGYYYEPHVAERIFGELLAESPHIDLLPGHELESATVEANQVTAVALLDRATGILRRLTSRMFIDATYEGDLFAAAGARFRLGRESRDEFDEPHAGVIYYDYERRVLLPGSTGEGDDRLPAYTFRLCVTSQNGAAGVLPERPENYDRHVYLPYLDDLAAGRLRPPREMKEGWGYYPPHFNTLVRALSVAEIPCGKFDVNINPRPLAFPFPEENIGYVAGDAATRARIAARHRNLAAGLLYFLQNDGDVPPAHRELARQLLLPTDEFTDNGHLPFQLYIREARRLVGEYTLTEHDVTYSGGNDAEATHPDAIALGEFPIDAFPARKRQPGDTVVLEGYLGMLEHRTRPYQIPYRIMIPEKIDGLIVPVAASATHVAYSTIRMEPTWMVMGQAAGAAAHVALQHRVAPRDVPIHELRRLLREQGQLLDRNHLEAARRG